MQGNGDYISREAAIELLKMSLDDDWEPEYAADRLSEIHAADVRPNVPGHWIYKPYKVGGMNINFPSCSECGYSPFVSMYYAVEDMHYCPNCGADMREEHDEKA